MEITLKAHMEHLARDAALTDAELDQAMKEGAAMAAARIATGQKIVLMDEGTSDRLQNSYAMGWNSLYGTDENQRLWDESKPLGNAV